MCEFIHRDSIAGGLVLALDGALAPLSRVRCEGPGRIAVCGSGLSEIQGLCPNAAVGSSGAMAAPSPIRCTVLDGGELAAELVDAVCERAAYGDEDEVVLCYRWCLFGGGRVGLGLAEAERAAAEEWMDSQPDYGECWD